MQSITPYPRLAFVFTLCWMVGGAALTLGGCVSQQTYDTARHEIKTRAGELAQTQADIHNLEQERDAAHLANQRDERALANLKHELKTIQASYDQLHKANQAKLALLEHNIAALRAKHQAMLKEISETKRIEKRLEALTTLRERTMATQQPGPEAYVTPVDTVQQEPHMVAVITPQPSQAETPSTAPTPAAAPSSTIPAPSVTVAPAPSTASPATAVAAPAAPNAPAKVSQAAATPPAPRPVPAPAPQDESWFSSVTGWFSSLIDWLWA
ncbi:MAG: hypothetical protein LZF60_230085 [Nitrospira sp.]|nr:MAG: hypothetical protein LZF60_230085 [Nitrospira sp.]